MQTCFPLTADSNVPSGNAEILELRCNSPVPEVRFTALPDGGPEAFWFHFRICPGTTGQPPARIRCVLLFLENLLGNKTGCQVDGFHPVYRTEHTDWTRCETVTRKEQSDGQIHAVWEVPGNEGEIHVALTYPYAPEEIDTLIRDTSPYWKSEGIGLTPSGNLLQRLFNRPGQPGADDAGIYCIARQHAAESPGSWVLDGFLRHIATLGTGAPTVWAVPFADVDGVLAGRPGKDSFPWDFNRAWGSKLFPEDSIPEYGSHPMRHEVKCLQLDLQRWKDRCRPRLVLDFHAPVMRSAEGIYCYLRDLENGEPDAGHAPWVEAIRQQLHPHLRAEKFVRSGRYPSRWNTARLGDFINQALGLPMITLENPYGKTSRIILKREDYRAAGCQIAEAVVSQLKGP